MDIMTIDSGWGGAICTYHDDDRQTKCINMPASSIKIAELFHEVYPYDMVYVEKVWGRPSQGACQTWRQAENYFSILQSLYCAGLLVRLVTPQTWQRSPIVDIQPIKHEGYAEHKRRLCERAKSIYPKHKVTLKNCDALLMMAYVRGET